MSEGFKRPIHELLSSASDRMYEVIASVVDYDPLTISEQTRTSQLEYEHVYGQIHEAKEKLLDMLPDGALDALGESVIIEDLIMGVDHLAQLMLYLGVKYGYDIGLATRLSKV